MTLERGMRAVVASAALSGIALVFIAFRCLSRFVLIKQAGTEDYLILFAMALSITLTVIVALRKLISLLAL
jgi:hypothetical protein